jgi:uncharacterized protein (TIGR02996 family)
MTGDGEALFRAVCESPADDTPRLVYADWLQENGQPERGEFILLQCEAWNLLPAYPTQAEARGRASALLRTHGDMWYAELPYVDCVVWSSLFVRGFVDQAHVLGTRFIKQNVLDTIFAATPIQTLIITDTLKEWQLLRLLGHPHIGRLGELRFPNTPFRAESQRLLRGAQKRYPNTKFIYT